MTDINNCYRLGYLCSNYTDVRINQSSIIFYLPNEKLDTIVNLSTHVAGYQNSCRARLRPLVRDRHTSYSIIA